MQYTKIIVPSGQPRSLYQALADARPAIDDWLTRETWGIQSVFQFHGAIDLADPNDHWSDLDMPGGFSCSDQVNDGRDALAVGGFPRLLDVLAATDHVMAWADEGHLWEGLRPLDLSSSALDLVGYFGSQNMQDRCSEVPNYYQGPDGQDQGTNLDQTLRSPYPHRSLYLHFGNCGEAQDVLGAATRTALMPSSDVNSFVDDHVWNLTQVDGRWLTWTINSSDDITGVGGNVLWKEKDWTTVIEFRGDGSIRHRTAMYTKHVTLTVKVTDAAGDPVDGASVLVASPARHDPSKLVVALLEWTDLDGRLSFDLGTAREYYLRVKSPAGLWPGPEDNKVEQVLTKSQCVTPGDAFELDVQLDGPPPAAPWDVTVREDAAPEGLALRVDADVFHHALEGDNTLYERRFNEWYEDGELDLMVLDEENYGLLLAALPFEALARYPAATSVDELVDVDPPAEGQGLYVVASNRDRLGHSAFADIVVSHEGEPAPSSSGSPAMPDATGGCQCGILGRGRTSGGWEAATLALLGLGWRRRRTAAD
ncbi:MAG: carboxypeptidase regulatory-like domain-containing protein [Deltaproteobacteria bacterium]|nr:carboxypeptidase regulatory-like domain-containing protein [Deltaproteobacteria bacterium]